MIQEQFNIYEAVKAGLMNFDLEGPYCTGDGELMFDRRYTTESLARYGLSPRTADFNIDGPEVVPIPECLQTAAGLLMRSRRGENIRRAGVKYLCLALDVATPNV